MGKFNCLVACNFSFYVITSFSRRAVSPSQSKTPICVRRSRRLLNPWVFVMESVYAGQMVRIHICTHGASRNLLWKSLGLHFKLAASRGFLRIPILCDRLHNDPASLSSARGCVYLWILINGKLVWPPNSNISASRRDAHYYYLPASSVIRVARGILIYYFVLYSMQYSY